MRTIIQGIFGLCMAASVLLPARALAGRDVPVEVPVQGVFLPARGYDDNDHIVLTITGELPHICYTLGETRLERRGPVIRVHQYAWLRHTGICATGDADPDLTVPYETEVSLGQLDSTNYELQFLRDAERGRIGSRHFNVAVAESSDIDNYAYAAVTDIISAKVIIEGEPVGLVLQGILDASCERLVEPTRVERQGDVFVVMPIVERNSAAPCRKQRREFRSEVGIGPLPAGQTLIHVRAMNGKAVNKILNIIKRY